VENFKFPKSPELKAITEKFSPFFKEARKRLYRTVFVFLAATAVGFFFYEEIIRLLINALSLKGINIVFTSPFQFINLSIGCGLVTGLIVVLPFFTAQVLYFIKPALKSKEFKTLIKLLPFSVILFVFGFCFGALIMKWQIEIFLNRSVALGIGNILDISSLLTTVFLTSALMGVAFQFPIILLLLLRIGILKHKKLSHGRFWVYLFSFVFAMFLPPDSILADICLSLPLIILFEITLAINRIFEKNSAKQKEVV